MPAEPQLSRPKGTRGDLWLEANESAQRTNGIFVWRGLTGKNWSGSGAFWITGQHGFAAGL
jgi:hypothetical protein